MKTKERINVNHRALGTVVAVAAAFLAIVAPSQASMQIDSFTTTSSTTQAGAHPDLITSFTLHEPGVQEAARNVIFNAPTGLFANPSAALRCTSSDFAQQQCPPNGQVGLATVYANYKGVQSQLLGTAPIYNLAPGEDQTGLLGLIVPTVGIPIQIPVAVRTGSDFGLRFTVSELTQQFPLARADLIFWGFPESTAHTPQRFPKGAPGEPAGCPGLATAECAIGVEATIPNEPLIDNPTVCTSAPLRSTLDRPVLPGSCQSDGRERVLPADRWL